MNFERNFYEFRLLWFLPELESGLPSGANVVNLVNTERNGKKPVRNNKRSINTKQKIEQRDSDVLHMWIVNH